MLRMHAVGMRQNEALILAIIDASWKRECLLMLSIVPRWFDEGCCAGAERVEGLLAAGIGP